MTGRSCRRRPGRAGGLRATPRGPTARRCPSGRTSCGPRTRRSRRRAPGRRPARAARPAPRRSGRPRRRPAPPSTIGPRSLTVPSAFDVCVTATTFVRVEITSPRRWRSRSPESRAGITRSVAPDRSHAICHGTMLAWCSSAETTTSSPARSRLANPCATRLMASVVPRVNTTSWACAAPEEPLDAPPRRLVVLGPLRTQEMDAAVYVGVLVRVVRCQPVEHGPRLLRRGRVVEVDERRAVVDGPLEDGEVGAEALDVEGDSVGHDGWGVFPKERPPPRPCARNPRIHRARTAAPERDAVTGVGGARGDPRRTATAPRPPTRPPRRSTRQAGGRRGPTRWPRSGGPASSSTSPGAWSRTPATRCGRSPSAGRSTSGRRRR